MRKRKFVRLMYLLLLRRLPENSFAIDQKMGLSGVKEIIEAFIKSEEYFVKSSNFVKPSIDLDLSEKSLNDLVIRTQSTWEALSASQPYFSVLTEKEYLSNSFDQNSVAFWLSGESQIKHLFARLSFLAPDYIRPKIALELGSGVGRLTIPLSSRVERLYSFEISTSMLDVCAENTRSIPNLELRKVTKISDFSAVSNIDLFLSLITLQHNIPPIQYEILSSIFRNLADGGIAIFQLITFRSGYSFSVNQYLQKSSVDMEMHPLPVEFIFELCRRYRVNVLDIAQDDMAGPEFLSQTFFVQKADYFSTSKLQS